MDKLLLNYMHSFDYEGGSVGLWILKIPPINCFKLCFTATASRILAKLEKSEFYMIIMIHKYYEHHQFWFVRTSTRGRTFWMRNWGRCNRNNSENPHVVGRSEIETVRDHGSHMAKLFRFWMITSLWKRYLRNGCSVSSQLTETEMIWQFRRTV